MKTTGPFSFTYDHDGIERTGTYMLSGSGPHAMITVTSEFGTSKPIQLGCSHPAVAARIFVRGTIPRKRQ